MASAIRDIVLQGGAKMPTLGLGTWRMGERASARSAEVAALKLGLASGITLIDTAEMYGEGKAEEAVAEAIAGRRDGVFLVSKVYPHNASRRGTVAACERSLKRLCTDYLDLYLLHWRGDIPLAQTVAAFEALRADGRIRAWGVSNFDAADIQELWALPGGRHCVVNQVLYHLSCRGVEWELLPLCRRHGIGIMAYSPFGQGRLLRERALHSIAKGLGATPAQLALAWLLAQPGVATIPKAGDLEHVREDRGAADLRLTPATLAELEQAFPGPTGPTSLAML
jgi:diketogulonate reductase-like aldo/keto reductase